MSADTAPRPAYPFPAAVREVRVAAGHDTLEAICVRRDRSTATLALSWHRPRDQQDLSTWLVSEGFAPSQAGVVAAILLDRAHSV
jgi:hypothetical protein